MTCREMQRTQSRQQVARQVQMQSRYRPLEDSEGSGVCRVHASLMFEIRVLYEDSAENNMQ